MTDQEIIQLISERKEHRALVKLYRYQGKVTALILKNGGSKDDAQDVFQDALLILCKKIWEGGFELTSKLDTFLYAICYNLWRSKSKDAANGKIAVPNEFILAEETNWEELFQKENRIKEIEKVLLRLGEPCLKLLKHFYYEAMRVKEIMKVMGYKTENTVKVQKYKCIERAKKMITPSK